MPILVVVRITLIRMIVIIGITMVCVGIPTHNSKNLKIKNLKNKNGYTLSYSDAMLWQNLVGFKAR